MNQSEQFTGLLAESIRKNGNLNGLFKKWNGEKQSFDWKLDGFVVSSEEYKLAIKNLPDDAKNILRDDFLSKIACME